MASFRDTDLLFARMDKVYNAKALLREAQIVYDMPAQAHHQIQQGDAAMTINKLRRGATEYHTGGWQVTCDMMLPENQKALPYCFQIMNDMPSKVVRCRILGLLPGHKILPHIGNLEEHEIVRIHVPLITAPGARMYAVDESVHIPVGHTWYLNQTRTHWVENLSDVHRLHMTIDLLPTDAVADWFKRCLIRVTKPRMAKEE